LFCSESAPKRRESAMGLTASTPGCSCYADDKKKKGSNLTKAQQTIVAQVQRLGNDLDMGMSNMAKLHRTLPFSEVPLADLVEAILKAKLGLANQEKGAYAASIKADEMPEIFRQVSKKLSGDAELKLGGKADRQIEKLCKMLDVNGDGVVSVQELASMLPMICGGEAVDNERYLFKMIDQNGDKQLSKAEFAQYLTPVLSWLCVLAHLPKDDALPIVVSEVVFSKMDANQDGFISPEEWLSWSSQFNLLKEVRDILANRIREGQLERMPSTPKMGSSDAP